MNWAYLTAMLGAGLTSTPMLLLYAFWIFVAGVLTGLLARARINEENESDAGDTHARLRWSGVNVNPAPPAPRPRLRAVGTALKPSYDGRKKAEQPRP
jgi:hypothetical protein